MKARIYFLVIIGLASGCGRGQKVVWRHTDQAGKTQAGYYYSGDPAEQHPRFSRLRLLPGGVTVSQSKDWLRVTLHKMENDESVIHDRHYKLNGTLEAEYSLRGAKFDGYYLNMQDGRLLEEGQYRNGLKDGPWKEYAPFLGKIVNCVYSKGLPWAGYFTDFTGDKDGNYISLLYNGGELMKKELFQIQSRPPKSDGEKAPLVYDISQYLLK